MKKLLIFLILLFILAFITGMDSHSSGGAYSSFGKDTSRFIKQ